MSLALNDVWLTGSAITSVIPHSSSRYRDEHFFDEMIRTVHAALGEDCAVDQVFLTSQTGFDCFNDLPPSIEKLLLKARIRFNSMTTVKSFSNSQPLIGQAAEQVNEEGIRALIIAMEPLNFFPAPERVSHISGGVLDQPGREGISSMMQGLNNLIDAYCKRFNINPSALAELKKQLTFELHAHRSNNPDAQRLVLPTSEEYDAVRPLVTAPLLSKYDCCPTTSQSAALVLGPDWTKDAVRVRASITQDDPRPLQERFAMADYPHDEALFSAANELFNDPLLVRTGLTRERVLKSGILELHNAVSPLMILLLIEMGFLTSEKAIQLFDEIDFTRINPSGGLLAGHPLAATAPVLLHQCRLQLLGQAPQSLQLPNVYYALIQSIAGLRDRLSLTLLSRE